MSVLDTPLPAQENAPEAAVIKAETVEAQALAFTATINRITPTVAGVWDLNETKDEVPSQTTFIPHKNPGQESVMEGDGRTPVDPKDFASGGKYRPILKLFINYENLPSNSYAHGTGWLIRPDLMVTAGHNVYSWRRTNGRLPGRAREIKAYAGYNGAKSISDSSVEFRRAKRVVTTSQWLDSASSRPRDFALVQFDQPFTDVTPFQYIETPASGDLHLGVVGYPADLKDPETGERGGKMYELFEQTKYDITADPDRMLAHYIDSEGGNSGGPVLRANDLVALGTHVYGGGDFNTASVLGRYGNPVQDYIGALDVPLSSPGQINMVTVGNAHISQADAATGPQTKEIAKLGDNVVAQAATNGAGSNPEFWIFEGAEEVFRLATDLAGALGSPIASVIGSTVAPLIAQGLLTNEGSLPATIQRFMLANTALLTAEAKFQKEEGWFDDLANAVTKPLDIISPVGSPVIRLPFKEIMQGIGLASAAADKLVNDVANEIARGILIRAQSMTLQAKAESAMDEQSSNTKVSANQAAFLEELAKAAKVHTSTQQRKIDGLQAEGWFDDAFKSIANVAIDAGTSIANITLDVVDVGLKVGETVHGVAVQVAKPFNAVGTAVDNVLKDVGIHLKETRSPVTELGEALSLFRQGSAEARTVLNQATSSIKLTESAFENEGVAGVLGDLRRLAQALIMHTVLADTYLSKQMERPVEELKAENFFDDLFKTPGSTTTTVGVGMIAAAGASTAVPVVGLVAAVPLFLGGFLTAGIGQALDGYKVGH